MELLSRTAAALEAALAAFGARRDEHESVEEHWREGDMAEVSVWFAVHDGRTYLATWHVFASGTTQLVHCSP